MDKKPVEEMDHAHWPEDVNREHLLHFANVGVDGCHCIAYIQSIVRKIKNQSLRLTPGKESTSLTDASSPEHHRGHLISRRPNHDISLTWPSARASYSRVIDQNIQIPLADLGDMGQQRLDVFVIRDISAEGIHVGLSQVLPWLVG